VIAQVIGAVVATALLYVIPAAPGTIWPNFASNG
jgi:glycerol uptake facilitator-like aquaporin